MLKALKEKFTKKKKTEVESPDDNKPDGDVPEGRGSDDGEKPEGSLSKQELKAKKKLEKAELKAKKKAEKLAKKGKTPKPPKPAKPPKPPKVKKPKLTKEEKEKLKQDKLAAKTKLKRDRLAEKTKRKVEKIRAAGAKRAEKIRLKQERISEKKRLKKEFNEEKKRFNKALKDEIKLAKSEVPKSNLPKVLIPLFLVVALATTGVVLTRQGIGPLAGFEMPEPPGFVKAIAGIEFNPLEKIKELNPLAGRGRGASGAEKAVSNMFDSLIALDFENAENYVDMSYIYLPSSYVELVGSEAVMNSTFELLEYHFVDEPEDVGDSVYEVTVEVFALDFKQLMAGFIREYLMITLDATESQAYIGVAGINTLFSQYVAENDLDIVVNEIVLRVAYADNSWQIEPGRDLVNALFGGALAAGGDFFTR